MLKEWLSTFLYGAYWKLW